jgi:hypothetical protein
MGYRRFFVSKKFNYLILLKQHYFNIVNIMSNKPKMLNAEQKLQRAMEKETTVI